MRCLRGGMRGGVERWEGKSKVDGQEEGVVGKMLYAVTDVAMHIAWHDWIIEDIAQVMSS